MQIEHHIDGEEFEHMVDRQAFFELNELNRRDQGCV